MTITTKDSIQAVEPGASGIGLGRRFGYLRSFFLFWFFVWPVLARICGYLLDGSAWLFVFGDIVWALSLYIIYDSLMKMIEARWPAAKVVREVVSLVFAILIAIGELVR